MKESFWAYWIVILGISILGIMLMLQSYTTTSEQDYYMMKEVMEAAMYDAVDYGYYRETGDLSMNAEKFVENFIRRFAETVNINKTYNIDFYQIYEMPPAASVSITTTSKASNYGDADNATESNEVTNRISGILYTNEFFSGYTSTKQPDPTPVTTAKTSTPKTTTTKKTNNK